MSKAEKVARESIELLKEDPENPREISPENAAGLGESMQEYGDLSVIVWNETTGELVAGHQRMDRLKDAGAKDWVRVSADHGYIEHPDTGERFGIRIVQWDQTKQRIANIVANSPKIAGEFTPAVLDQLRDLEDHAKFESLRLDALARQIEKDLAKEIKNIEDADAQAADDDSDKIKAAFAIVIECQSEEEQASLLDRFIGEGLKCRALI